MDELVKLLLSNARDPEAMREWLSKIPPVTTSYGLTCGVGCTCLVGTSFSVTDPWCPEHRVVMDFSGFVSTDLAED